MRRLNLTAEGRFLKSAKISGDTMGDFHPHGDQAIYDAMARLAQAYQPCATSLVEAGRATSG